MVVVLVEVVTAKVVGQIISPFFAKDFFNVTKFTFYKFLHNFCLKNVWIGYKNTIAMLTFFPIKKTFTMHLKLKM